MMDIQNLLKISKRAALLAGDAIMKVYQQGDFNISIKSDDSPLTEADRLAHEIIMDHLNETSLPIISEEGEQVAYNVRKNWDYYWLVDPLDGTKEFINRNGEFTVNIALIHDRNPILGVVYVPLSNDLYWAISSQGAFALNGNSNEYRSLKVSILSDKVTNVLCSRSHMNLETQDYIDDMINPKVTKMGSSLKFINIADGKADIYPKFGTTMEWDTAAAQIILEEAGGKVEKLNRKRERLLYNKISLENPAFRAIGAGW